MAPAASAGSAVAGDVMVLAFATEGEGIETLETSGDVRLATPGSEDTAAQTVTASTPGGHDRGGRAGCDLRRRESPSARPTRSRSE